MRSAGTVIEVQEPVRDAQAVAVLDEADLQARYERLLNLLLRMGAWLAGPQARLLPEEEWDDRFSHYQEQLDQLRLLGDALRPITLRDRYQPLSGDALIGEVMELFAA